MAQSLIEIAQTLKDANKKVQLIYAFNGTGKTRLSREFRLLVAPKDVETEEQSEEDSGIKVLYYNAFTEDLFFWDNDLDADVNRKLTIRPNGFTNLALNFLKEQGQDGNIVSNFQRYTSQFITPKFSEDFSEVTFSMERGGDDSLENIKISKGEESNFIWCVFYSLLEEVIGILNIPELEERSTPDFNNLEYIFIDDPVSSLDDTHLIELAVNIAELIKSSTSELKFIITTHNPLFYNVLFNEFNRVQKTKKWRLEKLNDGTFSLAELSSDSPFSYHLFLLSELEKAIQTPNNIQKYHFNFLRNLLEKTSTFLGYAKWEELLPQESREAYYRRIINLSSHSKHNGEEISIVDENDKRVLGFLVQEIKRMYNFKSASTTITTEDAIV
jgi:wobble nucleotide-excising tRNase